MSRMNKKDLAKQYSEYRKSVRGFHIPGVVMHAEAIQKAATKHGVTTRTINNAIAYTKRKTNKKK